MKKLDNCILLILSLLVTFCITEPTLAMDYDRGGNCIEIGILSCDTFPEINKTGPWGNGLENPFDTKDPSIIKKQVEYDPITGKYMFTQKIGTEYFGSPTYMTFEEYVAWKSKQQEQDYFNYLSGTKSEEKSKFKIDNPLAKFDIQKNLMDRLFGGTNIDIRPQGYVELGLGYLYNKTDNPNLTTNSTSHGGLDFNMNIQMNLVGKIGEKLNLNANYNTLATFDFENIMKLEYNTANFSEDNIVKSIAAGDVSLPLKGTLIQGSQKLFGLKTDLQFGHLKLTLLASQQKSKREQINIQGGGQVQFFEKPIDEYDENRHFFLSHYYRNQFENALSKLPVISSQVQITQIQVWASNDGKETQDLRDIVALTDLAEPDSIRNKNPGFQAPIIPVHKDITGVKGLPANDANPMYAAISTDPLARALETSVSRLTTTHQLEQIKDFEKVKARLLDPQEYALDPVMAKLGYISIRTNLKPSDILGVAYEYTYNGDTYKVGELTKQLNVDPDTPEVLFVKMLKSTTQSTNSPLWHLMMKNVYSIGAYQASNEDFKLDIFYEDPGQGQKRFLPETQLKSKPLIRIFGLDKLNSTGDPQPDGIFDFVSGVTIQPQTGRVVFPVLEPFGSYLEKSINDPQLAPKYVYNELYDNTLTQARQFPEKNRYVLKGSFKSTISNEISLNTFNLPQGSIRVSVGGRQLKENEDYTVDYNLGRVKILNDGLLQQGQQVSVSFEDNALFGLQTKTMLGLRADYDINKEFSVGGTLLKLFERPYTQKVNLGDDPINNTIYGLDVRFGKELPWLTKAVDRLPLVSTKAKSKISLTAETAVLSPGHASAINEDDNSGGTVYIDDFEGSSSNFDLKQNFQSNVWVLASTPQNAGGDGAAELFPESKLSNSLLNNVNRATVNWFRIDPNARNGVELDAYSGQVNYQELFPEKQLPQGINSDIYPFEFWYDPNTRGPYNFDAVAVQGTGTPYSAGINKSGNLLDPESRWAGVQRSLTTTDFEAANYEFLEFWLNSPYIENNINDNGYLYINLGSISEDVLKDSRLSFENGIPPDKADYPNKIDPTIWANVPKITPIIQAFDNDPGNRVKQDLGLDGLDDTEENQRFATVLDGYQAAGMTPGVLDDIKKDPSNDNFVYFGNVTSNKLKDRYAHYNGSQGNSPVNTGSKFPESNTTIPDSEDLNKDNTLNESESYFEYKIPIEHDGQMGLVPNKYIVETRDGAQNRKWYRFKIPREEYERAVGGISDFRSIRFIRMYATGFENEKKFRFATFDLVRNQWRKYDRIFGGIIDPNPGSQCSSFDVSRVGIEENRQKLPFNYVLPLGLVRENNTGVYNIQENEQSLALRVNQMCVGERRAVYKNLNMDLRLFDRMRMYIHAEEPANKPVPSGDISLFVRMGSDFEQNYYEMEVPLEFSKDQSLDPELDAYKLEVWKLFNNLDVNLNDFIQLKTARDNANAPRNVPYSKLVNKPNGPNGQPLGTNKISVVGSPNFGYVKGMMIGLVNKGGEPRDVEVWVNELRVNGLNEKGGVAGIARMEIQMADLAKLDLSGSLSTIGFGAIDQKLSNRNRTDNVEYDIAGGIELGKFLPEKSGVRLPLQVQYTNTHKTPEYDPYDLDVKLDDKIRDAKTAQEMQEIKDRSIEQTRILSYGLNNVRKERTNPNAKPKPWDIENWTASYSFTKTERKDPIIASDLLKNHHGSLNYAFAAKAKSIEPFKKLVKAKALRLIGDFNFNPIPNTFTFSNNLDRRYSQTTYRFAGTEPKDNTYFKKYFTWDRTYNLGWDLTKSLKFNFIATNTSVIDELPEYDDDGKKINPDDIRKTLWRNLKNFGRTKEYNHKASINYTLPTKLIPYMEWVTVRATVDGGYKYGAASLNSDSLGNILQNNQTRKISADFNMESLYDEFKYFKKIQGKFTPKKEENSALKNKLNRKSKMPSSADPEQQAEETAKQDSLAKANPKKKERIPSTFEKILVRPLLSIRKLKFDYQETDGSTIAGYMPRAKLLGMESGFGTPSWSYIAGFRPDISYLDELAANDKITTSRFLNNNFERSFITDFRASATIEPFSEFKIELDATRNFVRRYQELFKIRDPDPNATFEHKPITQGGSLNVSYFAANTLFKSDQEAIDLFHKFETNRVIISNRLGTGVHGNPEEATLGYTEGFGRYQQNVLIPAFLSAYTDSDPSKINLDNTIFKVLPRPNWKVTYNGLSKLPGLKNLFQSFSIKHNYKSTLTLNSYQYNYADYDPNQANKINPLNSNYYSQYEVPGIVINESFNPLIGVSMKFKNELSLDLEYGAMRNLEMSFINNQLAERRERSFTIRTGYKIKNVYIAFLDFGKKARAAEDRKFKLKTAQDSTGVDKDKNKNGLDRKKSKKGSDLLFSFDLKFSDNATFQYLLDQNIKEPTAGVRELTFRPALDYDISPKIKLTYEFNYRRSIPKVSISYPQTSIQTGFKVRYTL